MLHSCDIGIMHSIQVADSWISRLYIEFREVINVTIEHGYRNE